MSYMVNCTARFVVYTSNVSANDIPVGSDTNDGAPDRPYLTVTKARAAVPAGGKIRLNGAPDTPAVYDAGAAFSTSIEIETVVPLGAILAGTGTSEAMTLAPSNTGQSYTFRDMIIDPSENAGGEGDRCITLTSNFPYAPDFNFERVKFRNWKTYLMETAVSVRVGTMTFIDPIIEGGTVSGGVNLGGIVTGSLVVEGGGSTIAGLTAGSTAGSFLWNASATGVTATFTDFDQDITLDASVPNDLYYGIRTANCEDVVVDGGTHIIRRGSAVAANAQAAPISIETTATATPAHRPIVRNATVTNEANGGYGVKIGAESLGSFLPIEDSIVEDCVLNGDAASAAKGFHAAFLGVTSDGVIRRNSGTDIGLVGAKESTNVTVEDNNFAGLGTYGVALKAVTGGTVSGNMFTQTGSYAGASMIGLIVNLDTGTPTTGIVQTDNNLVVNGGTGTILVRLDVGCSFTPSFDDYQHVSGTLATGKFLIESTSYSNFSDYQATVEPTATSNIP